MDPSRATRASSGISSSSTGRSSSRGVLILIPNSGHASCAGACRVAGANETVTARTRRRHSSGASAGARLPHPPRSAPCLGEPASRRGATWLDGCRDAALRERGRRRIRGSSRDSTRRASVRRAPSSIDPEHVLHEGALTHVERTGRAVVVVQARLLRVEPADQPDVEVVAAVQEDAEALVLLVPGVRSPDPPLAADAPREPAELVRGRGSIAVQPHVEPAGELRIVERGQRSRS